MPEHPYPVAPEKDDHSHFYGLTVRYPKPVLEALDAYCKRTSQRRGVAVRDAVVAMLRETGDWPPKK